MRAVLGILIGLGLIVLVFVLILRSFAGGGKENQNQIDLVTYANTNAVAQLVLDAPVVADQNHHTVKITVSQNQTEIDIIQGYQGNVVTTRSYPNNTQAYAVFLQSLNRINFASGNSDPAQHDERGYCAEGNRYIYSFISGGRDLLRFWSTSCKGQGTFGGSPDQTRWLFEQQIPDFDELTNPIDGLIP